MTFQFSFLAALFSAGLVAAQPSVLSLADYGVRIDGAAAVPTRGDPLPAGVSISGFNIPKGLGSVTMNVRSPGLHTAALFVDHEIDQADNTFFNEFGRPSGSPTAGQSWEIDEPGYRFGNLFANFLAGRLDGSTNVPTAALDDVSMALGWNFSLGPNQTALIRMTVSETPPSAGFYLVQSDPESQKSIYFSSTLEISAGDTEPPVIACTSNLVTTVDPGTCFRSAVNFSVNATDNSPGVTTECTPPSGSRFEVGVSTIHCVARDTSGNSNQCSFTVTVRPEPPVIQCPGNLIVECALPSGKVAEFTVPASSPCDPQVIVRCQPPSGSVFPIGPTQVNCTATDSTDNRSDCSFLVFLVSSSTNCAGSFSLLKETCLAGEVRADPLLQPYPCGTCVEVTGVAADGWTFLGWLGDARGGARTTQLTMSQNKCVEAVFGTRISVGTAAGGTAWLDPVAPLYPCGTQARALARPNPGYYFSHWTNGTSDAANPLDFTVSQTNAILAPVFLPLPPGQSALHVETQGNGAVRGRTGGLANRYPAASNVFLRAIPDAGQDFLGWTMINDNPNSPTVIATNQITVSMSVSRQLVAKFTARPRIEIVGCQGELVKGLFRFKVHGKVLETLVIEASPTLNDARAWREVGRATNVLGSVQYEDPYLPNVPQRFYRARVAGDECATSPTLTVVHEESRIALEWPASSCDCTVQHSPSLSPLNWSPLLATPQVVSSVYRVSVEASGATGFFRLICNP